MNLGFSGPIEERREEVVKARVGIGLICDDLHLVRELNELRVIGEVISSILRCSN